MRESLPSRWKTWLLLSLALSGAAIVLLTALTRHKGVWASLRQLRLAFLGLALLIFVASWVVDGWRLRIVARAMGYEVRMRDAFPMMMACYFMAAVTPFMSGGAPVQIYGLHRLGVPLSEATAMVFVSGTLAQVVLFALALPVILMGGAGHDFLGGMTNAAVLLYGAGLAGYILLLLKAKQVVRLSLRVGRALTGGRSAPTGRGRRLAWRLLRFSHTFQRTVALLSLGRPYQLLVAALSLLLFYLLFFSLAPVLAAGLGAQVPYVPSLARQVGFYLLLSIVPTPGGSAAAELGIAAVFVGLVPEHLLLPLALSWRAITFYLKL
ncbi:MAG: flippase-like domain-containing protein, partial [Abditibacteriales bacterium]|nr:flippase-like domain-containing protein [Abditibacteriales bacterium]